MDEESSNMHATTVKNSISGNLGTKTKAAMHDPLIENDEPAVLNIIDQQEEDFDSNDHHHNIATNTITTILPDLNVYQNKKTAGTGMMDAALLVANVNQLRHIINTFERNPYFIISLTLVVSSIILQIVVGVFLIINSRYDVKDCEEICKANRINNWCTSLIFIITVINIILSAFDIPDMNL